MSAQDYLQPEQFGQVQWGNQPLARVHDHRYSKDPGYMAALEADIQKNGFRNPVRVIHNPDDSVFLVDGSHRASVAYHLGIPLPVSDGKGEDTRHTSTWHKKHRKILGLGG